MGIDLTSPIRSILRLRSEAGALQHIKNSPWFFCSSLKEKSWWRQSQVIPSVNLWLKKAEQKLPAEVRSVIDIAKQQF